jgi:hypothetical protein
MNFWEILVLVVLFVGNGWLQWWFAYMKKDGEYRSLNENIDGVLTELESMKNELEVIKDGKKHLGLEGRNALFELSSFIDTWYAKVG